MSRQILLFFIILLCVSCSSESTDLKSGQFSWSDPEIVDLYYASQSRDIDKIKKYLSGNNLNTVLHSLNIISSIPSEEFNDVLIKLLESDNFQVKKDAIYACGQIRSPELLEELIKLSGEIKDEQLKRELLTAIGKFAGKEPISFLSDYKPTSELEFEGHAKGLFHCLLNNNLTSGAVRIMVAYVGNKALSINTRRYAAGFLGRLPAGFDLNSFAGELREAFSVSDDIEVKQHLLIAFGHCNRDVKVLNILKEISSSVDEDFRFRVLAVQSLKYFPYIEGRDAIFKAAKSENIKVASEAGNYLLNLGNSNDAVKYLSLGAEQNNLYSSAKLLEAACKFGDKAILDKVMPFTKKSFLNNSDPYSKAVLIPLLAFDEKGNEFLSDLAKNGEHAVIRTTAFNKLKDRLLADYKEDKSSTGTYYKLFAQLLFSNDTVISKQTSGLFMSNDLGLSESIDESVKARIDTTNYLKSFKFFLSTGKKPDNAELYTTSAFDVSELAAYPDTISARIVTDQGVIDLDLYPLEAPITVLNFISLTRSGYLVNNHFHRVENNFVIQDGCARGDGYGHPSYKIISEFNSLGFDKGVLAMASSGRDTESSQWFITHRFSPHLDGNYTVFGQVKNGMENVFNIQVGSQVIDIEFENTNTGQ
ncbi:peptidylprolyl isomerase [Marinigracilibium pacificum]|uniref:peptidylprolyl isomerase n=1 Tax=Marinigracilibium pacificum TaxID=2729599 RepID=A0A848IYU5_9BACT|nr:peptidylprolyl isomerase [Marinigracilibium pacificum]NMM47169.1 hypothetical protein [Marinigracilibium pacificum]